MGPREEPTYRLHGLGSKSFAFRGGAREEPPINYLDVGIVQPVHVLLTKFSTCTCTCTAKFELALTASEISFSNFLRYLRKLSTGTGRYWPVLLEISLEI